MHPSPPPQSRAIAAMVAEAGRALQAGDLDGAQRVLHHILALPGDADRARARLTLAQIALLRGELAVAEAQLRAVPAALLREDAALEAAVLAVQATLLQRRNRGAAAARQWQHAALRGLQAGQADDAQRAILQTCETLWLHGQLAQAQDTLAAFLEEPGLPADVRLRLRGYQAGLQHRAGQREPALAALRQLLSESTDAETAVSLALLLGQLQLEGADPAAAIEALDGARRRAVGVGDPGAYLMVAVLLARAYEDNRQRPEAYGTLLRAQVSLTDLLGEDGGRIPQELLAQLRGRWGEEGYATAVSTFESRYRIKR